LLSKTDGSLEGDKEEYSDVDEEIQEVEAPKEAGKCDKKKKKVSVTMSSNPCVFIAIFGFL